jgi:glycosyltransferase involved in cell wall biosynthesis
VIACNLPLFSLWVFARHARRAQLPWILWHQDIYSYGMADELSRRFVRPIARLGARLLWAIEARIVRSASHVVAIGDAFTEVYDEWGVDPNLVEVVPNWSPLDKIFPVERSNRRSSLLFADDPDFRLVYAGTLGRKHNPDLLPQLVEQVRARGVDAQLAVVSEGEGAEVITRSAAAAAGHVAVFDFQPADYLPDVLGSADVLLALLEPDATKFSIPSKVLSYMAAGRPIVGLMPADNPAAIDIAATGGFVAEPDADGIVAATDWIVALAGDRSRITTIGNATRERAERQFDAEQVGDRFATMIRLLAGIPQDTEADLPPR